MIIIANYKIITNNAYKTSTINHQIPQMQNNLLYNQSSTQKKTQMQI